VSESNWPSESYLRQYHFKGGDTLEVDDSLLGIVQILMYVFGSVLIPTQTSIAMVANESANLTSFMAMI
jgi:hypothetical protein